MWASPPLQEEAMLCNRAKGQVIEGGADAGHAAATRGGAVVGDVAPQPSASGL